MRKIVLLMILAALAVSCGERGGSKREPGSGAGTENTGDPRISGSREDVTGKEGHAAAQPGTGEAPVAGTPLPSGTELPSGAVLIAADIVTEVVIRPDPEGDPWETEKVAGYNGDVMIQGIFSRIYDGTLTVYDYHSGEPLTAADVKKIEGEFQNDRAKIGKLSFTEDWYYFPSENRVEKKAKSVTFGYELYNNLGKVYAYRAAFRADLR